MSAFDIGALRSHVALQSPQEVDDGSGGVTVSWANVATVWADVSAISMREASVAGHLDGVVTHRVRLRFREDVSGGWRVLYGERTLRVLATRDADGRRRFLECLCEEEGR